MPAQKFSKVGVPAHALTRVLVIADWKESGGQPGPLQSPLQGLPCAALSASSQTTSEACAGCARPTDRRLRLKEVASLVETQVQVSLAPRSTQVSISEGEAGLR